MITFDEIKTIVKWIEEHFAKKNYEVVWERDQYSGQPNDKPENYATFIDSHGTVTFPHFDDYDAMRVDYDTSVNGKCEAIYEFWINNSKNDVSLIIEVWEEIDGNERIIKFGIIDVKPM